ncbi:MFS transporter [Kribbella sp. NPDC049227]|uniref:MFS transporter n=1 Tax=Kribbella sp. NPDC049227 TaxID=3364113 RepID=UPI0037141DB0
MPSPGEVGFRSAVAVGEFRALWIAHAQSRLGDQLARVAISILVFERTSSAALTTVTYALTLLPPLISAPLLSGLADRYSRRAVMVTTEICRAVVVGVMALPWLPLVALAALLVVIVSLQPLYSAARNAVLPNVLEGESYVTGLSIVTMTDNFVQVGGFAAGGALVGIIRPRGVLLLDAATFAVSAAVVFFGVGRHHPQSAESTEATVKLSPWSGVKILWTDRRLRYLLGLLYSYGFYIAPEGLASPYAAELGLGAVAVGLLMAADPVGAGVGSWLMTRINADARERVLAPLAVLSGVPLLVSSLVPTLPIVLAMWTLTGCLASYTFIAQALFVQAIPDDRRGRALGLAGAGLLAAQGLGIAIAGAVADLLTPSAAVGVMGLIGVGVSLLAGQAWNRHHNRGFIPPARADLD